MNIERAIHFLSLGVRPGQVASILGVSPGRISQLLSQPEVKEKLDALAVSMNSQDVDKQRIEAKELAAKDSLLDSITARREEATFMELARAYDIICRAESYRKNPLPMPGAQIFNGTVVQIAMPIQGLKALDIQVTKAGEIIAVGDRELAPMSATGVMNLFKAVQIEGECHEC